MFRFWKGRGGRPAEWRSFGGYSELHRELRARWPVPPAEFLDGPLPRFLEFATATDYVGDQIRTVEHVRHWVCRIGEEQRRTGGDAAGFEAAARAMAESAFQGRPWLMEAYDGLRGHHG